MSNIIKKMVICICAIAWLTSSQVYGEDAMDYFNLGLKSSITRTKIKYFSKALELNPKLAAAYENRGLLYYFQGKYDETISDYREYIAISAPKAEAFRMIGLGYLKIGLYEDATSSFSDAIKQDPEFAAAYANRAEAHRLCGKHEEAIRDSTKAIKLGKDPTIRGDAYRTRAKVYRKTGRFDLAVADNKATASEDPRYPFLRFMSDSASLEGTRKIGLILIIGIAFLFIFKLKLKPPEKDD